MDKYVYLQIDFIFTIVKKDEFINLFLEKTKKLKIGNGMDPKTQLGPLTTEKRLNEIEELVEKTKQEGAKVLLGGQKTCWI
jgi:succinate-semialdehyde dehydrogenase/glutarate-semialdehyde dehydrogenase